MSPMDLDALCSDIKTQIGCSCDTYTEIGNDQTLIIPSESLSEVIELLNERYHGVHLSAITGQQREDESETIELIYHFFEAGSFSFLFLLPAGDPIIPSIVGMIPGADFYEREAAEMFGVRFSGREETPPLLLPDDWDQGPPFIRKEVDNE